MERVTSEFVATVESSLRLWVEWSSNEDDGIVVEKVFVGEVEVTDQISDIEREQIAISVEEQLDEENFWSPNDLARADKYTRKRAAALAAFRRRQAADYAAAAAAEAREQARQGVVAEDLG